MAQSSSFDAKRVAAVIARRGYSDAQIANGLAYAEAQDASSDNAAFCLALARILYSYDQLRDGGVFDGDEAWFRNLRIRRLD